MNPNYILILFTLFLILCTSIVQSTTQYKYTCLFNQCRNKITTTTATDSVSYTRYVEQCSFDNKKGVRDSVQTYTISHTSSRTASASASVGMDILGIEIKATLSGEVSYSTTKTISNQVTIPPGKVVHILLRDKRTTTVFIHHIEPQVPQNGVWVHDPNPNVSTRIERSYVTTVSPDISFEYS